MRQNAAFWLPTRSNMFVTAPCFMDAGMTALAGRGDTYWRAVVADFKALPWYMFVSTQMSQAGRASRVLLVSWEESLIDLIETTPSDCRIAVYRVDIDPTLGVLLRTVRALWRASSKGYSEGHLAFLALDGDGELVPLDSFLEPVASELVGELAFELGK